MAQLRKRSVHDGLRAALAVPNTDQEFEQVLALASEILQRYKDSALPEKTDSRIRPEESKLRRSKHRKRWPQTER